MKVRVKLNKTDGARRDTGVCEAIVILVVRTILNTRLLLLRTLDVSLTVSTVWIFARWHVSTAVAQTQHCKIEINVKLTLTDLVEIM